MSSPLDRCAETAAAVAAGHAPPIEKVETDERFGEVRYGDWTGRPQGARRGAAVAGRAGPPERRPVPRRGRRVLAAAQHRAVTAVRDWNERVAAEHGPEALYAVCSHGDIIKSVVADALGLHLDQFQRIQADPASLTVIRYTETRPFVVRVNDTGGDVAALVPQPPPERRRSRTRVGDAPVGGGA